MERKYGSLPPAEYMVVTEGPQLHFLVTFSILHPSLHMLLHLCHTCSTITAVNFSTDEYPHGYQWGCKKTNIADILVLSLCAFSWQ